MATTLRNIKHHNSSRTTSGSRPARNSSSKKRNLRGCAIELSRQRRELPWEKVEKQYEFEGPSGKAAPCRSLRQAQPADRLPLHARPRMERGLPQLLVHLADHFDGMAIHLANRDVTLAVVSHAPFAEIEAFRKRMGWRFNWYSSFRSTSTTTTMSLHARREEQERRSTTTTK